MRKYKRWGFDPLPRGRFPGGGHENPLQYSCLENPMDRESWWATVQCHEVRHDLGTKQPSVFLHIYSWGEMALLRLPSDGRLEVRNVGSGLPSVRCCCLALPVQFSSVVQLHPALCDPMNCSLPSLPVHHQLLEFTHSCPLSLWCHPNISSSVIPFSSCLQSCPASGSFPMSQFLISGGQSIGVSALASVLPMNIRDWFPLGQTGWVSL